MNSGKNINRFLIWLGVAILQLIMTQVVTFLLSLFLPGMGNYPQTQPALFVVILGVTFSFGVSLMGWLALKLHWLAPRAKFLWCVVASILGAYLPLVLALFIYPSLEPGNPFFSISMLTSVLAFHLPGWFKRS